MTSLGKENVTQTKELKKEPLKRQTSMVSDRKSPL